jgi:hypothetical protein
VERQQCGTKLPLAQSFEGPGSPGGLNASVRTRRRIMQKGLKDFFDSIDPKPS